MKQGLGYPETPKPLIKEYTLNYNKNPNNAGLPGSGVSLRLHIYSIFARFPANITLEVSVGLMEGGFRLLSCGAFRQSAWGVAFYLEAQSSYKYLNWGYK